MPEFDRIFNRFDDFFDRLFDRSLIHYLPYTTHWKPPTDVYETARSFLVVMEVPGVEMADIRVDIRGDRLTVSGVRRSPAPKNLRRLHNLEIPPGPFRRTFLIHAPIQDKIRVRCRQGLLVIELWKKKE